VKAPIIAKIVGGD
jgi:hypothetical protein